jgi:phosphatidylethanolamine/phosphatidyl-N-methylethanolamine N-methyltransferase
MGDLQNGTGLRDHFLLFSRFLRSPRTVGALSASSRALGDAMVENTDMASARVAELGPGTGALTAAIVDKMADDTRLLAIDIDKEFVAQICRRWPHIECVCDSAERLDELAEARDMFPLDHIVSGLPFVSLPLDMTREILRSVHAALRPGGTFTTFQYLHGYPLPTAAGFRRAMTERMGGAPTLRYVMRNVPPAVVLTWEKKG